MRLLGLTKFTTLKLVSRLPPMNTETGKTKLAVSEEEEEQSCKTDRFRKKSKKKGKATPDNITHKPSRATITLISVSARAHLLFAIVTNIYLQRAITMLCASLSSSRSTCLLHTTSN